MRRSVIVGALGALVLLAVSPAAGGPTRPTAGPGYSFSGLAVTYDASAPFNYHIVIGISGDVCTYPTSSAWSITVTHTGFPQPQPPHTAQIDFVAANPALVATDQYLVNGVEVGKITVSLLLTPGSPPTLAPQTAVVGGISNVTVTPAQITATPQTLDQCAAAPAPPPAGSLTGSPAPGRPPGKVKLPGTSTFVPVTPGQSLPPGTVVDVSGGAGIVLTGLNGQQTVFYGDPDGVPSLFVIGQSVASAVRTGAARTAGSTELRLTGGNFATCKAKSFRGKAAKPVRRLWGKGKGNFKTRGRYAAAAVRGTWWLTADFCDRTLVTVKEGVVVVTDLVKKKTVLVRAGKSYSAAPKKKHP